MKVERPCKGVRVEKIKGFRVGKSSPVRLETRDLLNPSCIERAPAVFCRSYQIVN